MTTSVTSGKSFTQTYAVKENVDTEPSLHISQEAFPLCEADFLRIKHGDSKVFALARVLFLAAFGMILGPVAKFAQTLFSQQSLVIHPWEWIAPTAGFGIALVLFLVGRVLPNERKQVMKDIEVHFSEAPRTRHLGERKK